MGKIDSGKKGNREKGEEGLEKDYQRQEAERLYKEQETKEF
jgi:hypothetical protein